MTGASPNPALCGTGKPVGCATVQYRRLDDFRRTRYCLIPTSQPVNAVVRSGAVRHLGAAVRERAGVAASPSELRSGVKRLGAVAEDLGFLLLSPASEGGTWDAIRGGYDADVRLIDRALALVFAMVPVHPERVSVAGFSDGASYACGPPSQTKPRIFVSHGTRDEVLPIDACSRPIMQRMKASGYVVKFVEFNGGHTFSAALATYR